MDGIHVSFECAYMSVQCTVVWQQVQLNMQVTQLCHNMEPVDAPCVEVVLHVIAP